MKNIRRKPKANCKFRCNIRGLNNVVEGRGWSGKRRCMYIGGHETRQDAHRRFLEHAAGRAQNTIYYLRAYYGL